MTTTQNDQHMRINAVIDGRIKIITVTYIPVLVGTMPVLEKSYVYATHDLTAGPDVIKFFPMEILNIIIETGGFYFNQKFFSLTKSKRFRQIEIDGEKYIIYKDENLVGR